jgi:hypothetical protein
MFSYLEEIIINQESMPFMYGTLVKAPSAEDFGLAYSSYIISQASGVIIEILLNTIKTIVVQSEYCFQIL